MHYICAMHQTTPKIQKIQGTLAHRLHNFYTAPLLLVYFNHHQPQ